MPGDLPSTTPVKRPKADRNNSTSSITSQSAAEGHAHSHRPAIHKRQSHTVGHGRGRNASFGRTLSKININAANASHADDVNVPQSARNTATSASLMSPRHKSSMRRTQTSVALHQRSHSSTMLKKNHSSGQLHRPASAKHSVKRPDFHRSKSQPDKIKHKSPPLEPVDRPAAVRFDMGDDEDEDGEEMEGVDDGWTEESASQSPNTTRENTRNNTRQNSVVLDPEENPYIKSIEKPPDEEGHEEDVPEDAIETVEVEDDPRIQQQDFAPTSISKSSYQEGHEAKPPNADAIAKRLFQRTVRTSNPPPTVSQVSALADASANATPNDPNPLASRQNGTTPGVSRGGTPMVSRFIEDGSAPGSKDGTPVDAHEMAARKTPMRDRRESTDMKRNQSAPNFASAFAAPPDGQTPGTSTPGGPQGRSRTQQKLWLQRGLSNIEANSQQHLPGMLTSGRTQRGGNMLRQYEKVEKELAVVRRYRSPLIESMERLRKMKLVPKKTTDAIDTSPKKPRQSRDGTRTPGADSIKSSTTSTSAPRNALRSKVSFALSAPEDDDDDEGDATPDWQHMTLEEIEEATMDIRRSMWELQPSGEAE